MAEKKKQGKKIEPGNGGRQQAVLRAAEDEGKSFAAENTGVAADAPGAGDTGENQPAGTAEATAAAGASDKEESAAGWEYFGDTGVSGGEKPAAGQEDGAAAGTSDKEESAAGWEYFGDTEVPGGEKPAAGQEDGAGQGSGESPAQSGADGEGPMIFADNLVKIYKTAELEVLALQGLDLTVERGELLAIIGNSGSGKSTFLNMLGGLDTPSAGKLFVDGKDLFKMTEKQLVEYKRDTVGFVWQNNARNLLPYLSALENVMTPMQFSSQKKRREKALQLLEMVGMSHKKGSRLNQLSGGEQQRIAIAIALANAPKLLLADEPTGSVDRKTADYILDVFRNLNREMGQTILIVTHDVALSKRVQRVVAIRDGKFSSERILKESYSLKVAVDSVNWQEEDTQEEFAIIDRAGRVQIPRQMLEEAGVEGNKVRMEMKDGKIVLEKV